MVSETHGVDPSDIFAEFPSRQGIQTKWAKIIMFVSFLFVSILWSLPHRFVNGSIVPTVIFSHPLMFHAFVISIIFSFTGAFSLLLLGYKPKIAPLRRFYFIVSLVCMASALSILACALFLESCRLLVSQENREDYFLFSATYFRYSEFLTMKTLISPGFEELPEVA